MNKIAATVLIVLSLSTLFGAKVASAQAWANPEAELLEAVGDGKKAEKAAVAKAEAERLRLEACRACSPAEVNDRFVNYENALKDIRGIRAGLKKVNAHLEKLRSATEANRVDIDEARTDIARLKGYQKEDRKQLVTLTTKVRDTQKELNNQDIRIDKLDTVQVKQIAQINGLDTRTTAVENRVSDVEKKAQAAWADSLSLRPEFSLGYSRSFAANELVLGAGGTFITRATGDGVYSSFTLGLAAAGKPRLTSGALRIGYAWALGGPSSSLICDMTGHVALVSQDNVSDTQEGQVGIGIGAKYLEVAGPVYVGVRLEHTWGVNDGLIGTVNIGIEPSRGIAAANQPRQQR